MSGVRSYLGSEYSDSRCMFLCVHVVFCYSWVCVCVFADPNSVCLEDYPIHTVTGLVKQWLRELPEPLMTFNHYNDFLHAVGEF